MAESRLGFGLIGLGMIYRAHLEGYRALSERAQVVAVCDRDSDLVEREASAVGATAYTDYQALLDDPLIAAVDITLPHNLHYQVAKDALEAGKHVIIEKPLALTSADCLSLIDLAERQGVSLTVAENTPFVKAYQEVDRILREGKLGAVRSVRTFISGSEVERLRDRTLWKGRRDGTGGGALIDAGVHSFYLLNWLFGPIASVCGHTFKLVEEAEVEDQAFVVGTFARGGTFSSEFNFVAEIPWGERLEVYCEEGTLIIDQLASSPALHYRGREDYTPQPLGAVPYNPSGWKTASIAAGVVDFADAVIEGRPPTVDPHDGLYAVLVAEKAYASVEASGAPIRVPEGRGRRTGGDS